MSLEIFAVGGYGEVGRNMTAVKVDDEVVVFDMGLHLPHYISHSENEEGHVGPHSRKELIAAEAIPNDNVIEDWRKLVVAIIPSHAHLDHVGAIPFLASRYKCPIYATPFTVEVIHKLYSDQRKTPTNPIKSIPVDGKVKLSASLTAEFVNMTHSIPHTAMVLLHTPYGTVLYGNDFKFDDTPTLGDPPSYDALEAADVKLAIIDTLYAHAPGKTPSEKSAEEQLEKVLLGNDWSNEGLIVTTFSSQTARLRSIVKCARKMKRKIMFVGRSLAKYTFAARDSGVEPFDDIDIVQYGRQMHRKLRAIQHEKGRWLLVTTGHQGEPNAVLSRICNGKLKYNLDENDVVVFSCKTIPAEPNISNRKVLEKKLKDRGVKVFTNVHASGHGMQEDIRQLLQLVKADIVLPSHSEDKQIVAFMKLAAEEGYKKGSTARVLHSGEKILIE